MLKAMTDADDTASRPPEHALPLHVGIIMDGNGRWAVQRGLARSHGHKEGLEAAKRVVKAAADLGLSYLSVFAFSTENWRRTEDEVKYLMFLVKHYLRKEYDFYKTNRIRLVHSGDLSRLPDPIAQDIRDTVRDTAGFTGLCLNIALNYGGRDEIIRAIKRWQATAVPAALDEQGFGKFLDQPDLPGVDLLIRTGGEKRISNFLLWQSAYAELYFSDTLWPDWDGSHLAAALDDFKRRDRRYGGVT
jgi:undecaprenyl diphosphate synthase